MRGWQRLLTLGKWLALALVIALCGCGPFVTQPEDEGATHVSPQALPWDDPEYKGDPTGLGDPDDYDSGGMQFPEGDPDDLDGSGDEFPESGLEGDPDDPIIELPEGDPGELPE